MGEHVAITVKLEAPSDSDDPALQFINYAFLMLRSLLICIFAGLRIHYVNEAAFENNREFTIICLVASFWVAVLLMVLLLSPQIKEGEDCCFLRFVGSFSAFLAPFSLLMVIVLPHKLNWIGYLVVCVMFVIIVTCFSLYDQQQDYRPSTFNNVAIYSIFFLTFLSLFFPTSGSNLIMYGVIYVSLWLETAYHFIAYVMFLYDKKTRRPEAYQPIQKDENNDGSSPNLSYLMPLRTPFF